MLPLALLHAPPLTASVSVIDAPAHIGAFPFIAVGAPFTVTTTDDWQPAGVKYTTVAVPGVTPVTTPLVRPTVTLPLADVQLPPGTVAVSVIAAPTHIGLAPPMVAVGLTVAIVVARQPEPYTA